jgi:uncharacterized membrane protein
MDKILAALQRWDLHPVVDHFTVGLLVIGVLIDLVATRAPSRTWLRYTALLLMILGAIAAGASYYTGGLEANRIYDALSAPAKEVFGRHAKLGEYMAVVFGVLAVWRILIEAVGFFAGSRMVYLIFAVISAGILLYIGSLGGKMVYEYGVGTALMSPPPTPAAIVTAVPNESLPTVSVSAPTPSATTSPVAIASPPAGTVPTPLAALPTATPTPKVAP